MICQGCKCLSSVRRCGQVTHSRAPLDSTAIYPTTRSPKETGKIENLSRLYLCLAHSLWARWWRSWLTQVGTPFLIVLASTCLMKTSPNTPPYTIMGEPCLASSSRIRCKLQAYDISGMAHLELALHILLIVLINLNLLFALCLDQHCIISSFLHLDDVLEVNMNVHSIFFSKPYLQ